jgi:hypothetical protein
MTFCVAAAASLTLATTNAVAQAPASAQPQGTPATIDSLTRDGTISRLLEDHARQVLRRYVQDSEFSVVARVEMGSQPVEKVPYLPPAQSAAAMGAFPPARLVAQTDRVTFDVALAKRYRTKTRDKLGDLLAKSLGLRSGDGINFEELDLELPAQRSDLEVSLLRTEADLRQERTLARQALKERDDLKLEVVAAKTEIERQARLAKPAADTATTAPGAPATGQTPTTMTTDQGSATLGRVRDFGVPIVFAVVGIFFAVILARSFRGIGQGIGEAAEAVSRAIESSVGAGASAALGGAPTLDVTPESGSSQSAALPPPPLESLKAAVKELHDDLTGRLNEQTQPFVVQYLTQQLSDVAGVDKGVAAMELFGRDHANALFKKLNPAAQTVVLDFIRHGHYSRPKLELMHEAGEEINTRLLGQAVMQSVSQVSQDITAKVMALQIEDLAKLAITLSERLTVRLLASLEPGRIAALLAEVHRSATAELGRVTALILKIPEIGSAKELDQELLQALTKAATAKAVDVHKPYLKFYGDIMAAAEDHVGEAMLGNFMGTPQVATYIRSHAVTFSMFFQVTRDIQEDVVAQLSVKDLAALYAGIASPEDKSVIDGLLTDRRRDAMREEAVQWTRRGARQLQTAHKAARQAVCRRLATLQRSGGLDFRDTAPEPTLPATPVAA